MYFARYPYGLPPPNAQLPTSSRNLTSDGSVVAQALRFCIEADFVTGQNIVVDGGRLLRP